MKEDIAFHIGKEVHPFDKPPFRAFFRWTSEGRLVKSEDFSKQELEAEIASGKRKGTELECFKEALIRLSL